MPPTRIDILTLFPGMFESVLGASILRRAAEPIPDPADPARIRPPAVSYHLHDIRGFTTDRHRRVDQPSFGGGPGMVLQCQPVWDAILAAEAQDPDHPPTRIVLTPQGQPLTQPLIERLARRPRLLLLAGHYEGFDQRVLDRLHARPAPPQAEDHEDGLLEISLGDYVLTGGELPAMVLIDAVVRLIPGVLGDAGSAHHDSFSPGAHRLLDHPHYTRPRDWRGLEAPAVLLSGDHTAIEQWRRDQARALTAARRPDLLTGPANPAATGPALTVALRDAGPDDAGALDTLLRAAFPTDAEARLIRQLDEAGHAMFSILADHDGRPVGHIMLSEMTCADQPGLRGLMGLAPLAVDPAYQRRGIGTALVHEAIRQARAARVRTLFVLGDPAYYHRFGFRRAADFGWTCAWPEAADAFAALPFTHPPVPPPGRVDYAPPFAQLDP